MLPAFNGSSPACDLTAEAVYANYGRPEDFKRLEDLHISVAGKIVLVRYGMNFRGVKVYLAQQRGAAGVIIYSDPADDGYFQGDKYPHGPWRPDTGVQRGSVQYMFKYPGDATTPDVASTPGLPASKRLPLSQISSLPTIPSMPLSYRDAAPILENLGGPVAPREWQGALPFSYHVGGGGLTKVHMRLKMDYAQRTVWDVIGKVTGSELPDEWVVAGNHRDAWVYGAVDPASGTTAMLEAVTRHWQSAGAGLETAPHPLLLQLGCGRRGPDRFHRVGRGTCQTAGPRSRVHQHRRQRVRGSF